MLNNRENLLLEQLSYRIEDKFAYKRVGLGLYIITPTLTGWRICYLLPNLANLPVQHDSRPLFQLDEKSVLTAEAALFHRGYGNPNPLQINSETLGTQGYV